MNRVIRSRLTGIAVILIIPLFFTGCINCKTCELCFYSGMIPCLVACAPVYPYPPLTFICPIGCTFGYIAFVCAACVDMLDECSGEWEPWLKMQMASIEFCKETPDEFASTYEQFQLAATEYCEEHPEKCQEAFDTWLESFDEEAMQ